MTKPVSAEKWFLMVPWFNAANGFPQFLPKLLGYIQDRVYIEAGRLDLLNFREVLDQDLKAHMEVEIARWREHFTEQMQPTEATGLIDFAQVLSECIAWRKIGGMHLCDPYIDYEGEKALERLRQERSDVQQMIWSRLGGWLTNLRLIAA
ncbi:MAG TPA: hypothetical protein VN495_00945 [Candidatus Paceibacterota bacterium]|nr:hypothetical protein [Candidatus Paceibacterota bacterium]